MNTTSLPIIQLTILGCGTLGSAIVDGLCNQPNPTRSYRLRLTGRRENHITRLKKKHPEAVVSIDNRDPRIWAPVQAATAHLVVIGTQPEFTKAVCTDICDSVEAFCQGQTPIILTVCPGITTSQLESWLPFKSPIVRSMPNTPVAVGQGATALFANELVSAKAMDEIKLLLLSVSPCIEFLQNEDLLDVVASVSGSGPAYMFYLAKEMVNSAVEKGLSEKQVTSLLIQSIIGAGILAQSVPNPLSKHLNDVCVPGGSTEKAMATLDLCGAGGAIQKAVHVSWEANKKMGNA